MDSHVPGASTLRRLVLVGAIAVCLLFGVLVHHKQVRLRQGDQGVFYRAAWSIRQGGGDLYSITDDHGWHYHYPPLFAILMVPLAEPPFGTPQTEQCGLVQPQARMVLLYLLNLACLFGSVGLLAGCLSRSGGASTPDSAARRLHLFVWPTLICLPAIGLTLVRGQVDLLLLLLLSGFTAGLIKGRRFTAGLCLATAISIKIIPAFLLLLPLWQRDRRCLAGCLLGLFVGLWVVPALVLGPARTIELYGIQKQVLLAPALGLGEDSSRGQELLDAGGTVNQSFQMVLHLTMHFGEPIPPPQPAAWVRAIHWALTLILTALVLWRQGRTPLGDRRGLVGLVGLLMVIMLLASPVCHLHYFTLVVPLALAVVDRLLDGDAPWYCWAVLLPPLGYTVFMLPRLAVLRDLGMPLYATLALWVAGWLTFRPGASGRTPADAVKRAA